MEVSLVISNARNCFSFCQILEKLLRVKKNSFLKYTDKAFFLPTSILYVTFDKFYRKSDSNTCMGAVRGVQCTPLA